MSPTIHKILHHSPDFVEHFKGLTSMYSEEALESRNKDFKTYRRRFTRKSRRENTNRDLLTRMLLTSDPFLSSIRKAPEAQRKFDLHQNVKSMMDTMC